MSQLLQEMAYPRKKVLSKIDSYADEIEEHLTKIVIYKNNTDSLNHWISELANIFEIIGGIKVKDVIKLKENEYIESAFGSVGEDIYDYMINLRTFKNLKVDYEKKYPDFNLCDELAENYSFLIDNILKKIIPMLADKKKSYNISEYKKVLEEIIK